MKIALKICIICLMFQLAAFASILDENKSKKYENSIGLSKVVRYIIDAKLRSSNRRQINEDSLNLAQEIAAEAEQTASGRGDAAGDHAYLVEKELKLANANSALHDRPYIEKLGRNDFLVMQPEAVDPFVTVIPNQVYYDIEKKCVNWLADCSLKGIRERLLKGSRFRN
ncbi:hypothetical protein PYW07_000583 [Mythimna separata]|uniref:Uncharacterized protein n=1 Tax=Mythimna separata TaxID=271217 RepID=A0AAD7Z2F3_MYTSE|nr:hypothetical protein PYW07_000583 [Mythimna separata]